ncbi:alanine:cation symporter family protein [Actinomyces sp. zg-332]|uniref:alanine/glycine:cation symporter family protein n=1 Tax=Actinomyces sp. zg-332 TaxID=2708340 RepID=UPI00142496AE|nr:alanine/glycine:cation symporter family protein [Actinomyces sp. zg-332]QPK93898.1 alanine:cation symporter family protein [Actinomyces sp. zg-332]
MLDKLASSIQYIGDQITLFVTVWLLIGTGIYFTVRSRGVQIRYFGKMLKEIASSRKSEKGEISSFQAFAISLAGRVGLGNVFGVAAALILGGPGAIFWMWIVALVGMSTSFFETILAQAYKVKNPHDSTFRGGPAWYIQYGLGSKKLGNLFAIVLVVTCSCIMMMLQSNGIAETLKATTGASSVSVAVVMFVLIAPVIFGGIKSVARVSEFMAPIMSLVYVVLAIAIMVINYDTIIPNLVLIVKSAFVPTAAFSGIGAGLFAALINGIKRGLFSNEAGQGTSPNAAAVATVKHPVEQGLIQSFGVFVDTIVVCTATALIIMSAGKDIYNPNVQMDPSLAGSLTHSAVASQLGSWTTLLMSVIIFVLAYSSMIAAYTYSEVNMFFVTPSKIGAYVVRVVSVISAVLGAVVSLQLIWSTVDIFMALITVLNVLAVLALSKQGLGILKDYEDQKRNGIATPRFIGVGNKHLPADLPTDVWVD